MKASPRRRADLAKIHIAKKDLKLDDETYRDMLWTVGRVRTAADLTSDGLTKVLVHLQSRGFKSKSAKQFPGRPHNVDGNAQLEKIEALLADARRPWAYVDSMAQKMCSVDRVAFCNPHQLQQLISALMYDQRRRSKTVTP